MLRTQAGLHMRGGDGLRTGGVGDAEHGRQPRLPGEDDPQKARSLALKGDLIQVLLQFLANLSWNSCGESCIVSIILQRVGTWTELSPASLEALSSEKKCGSE